MPYYTRVIKLSPTGAVLWTGTVEMGDVAPEVTEKALAVLSNGGCVVQVDVSKIVAFSSEGAALWEIDSDILSTVRGIIIGDDGFIYVTDNNGVHQVSPNGSISWTSDLPAGSG